MVIAVDVGTTVMKAGLFSKEGRQLDQAYRRTSFLRTADPEHYEVNPDVWIAALEEAIYALETPRRASVEAIVVSGNGPTLVAVDGSGAVVYPAITWMDRRGVDQAAALIEESGLDVDVSFYLAKAFWICRKRPDVYEKTKFFFSCPEYIAYHLCGDGYTILPCPPFDKYIWTEAAIAALGMDKERFPPFIEPGAVMGGLRPSLASRLGLETGTPIVAGGPDYLMSLVGTATIEPGRSCDRAGTSEGIVLCSERQVVDKRLLCLPSLMPGLYTVSGVISTTGKAIEWYRTTSGYGGQSYDCFWGDVAAARAGSGALIFLPYLAGERSPLWDPHARGVFCGLTVAHSRKEMARAVVEAVGFAMRDVLEVIAESSFEIDALRVAGAQSKWAVLNQIKADITGRRILVPSVPDSELLGAACIGLAAIGEFDNFAEAAGRCVQIESEIMPDKENWSLYTDLFSQYRELYRKLKNIFEELADESREWQRISF